MNSFDQPHSRCGSHAAWRIEFEAPMMAVEVLNSRFARAFAVSAPSGRLSESMHCPPTLISFEAYIGNWYPA